MRIKKTNSETIITRSIRQYLAMNHIYHWKNAGGPFAVHGVSDILGILDDGRFLAIEVKTDKGKVTKPQDDFINAINERGGVAFIARSVDEVQSWLRVHGVPLKLQFKGV